MQAMGAAPAASSSAALPASSAARAQDSGIVIKNGTAGAWTGWAQLQGWYIKMHYTAEQPAVAASEKPMAVSIAPGHEALIPALPAYKITSISVDPPRYWTGQIPNGLKPKDLKGLNNTIGYYRSLLDDGLVQKATITLSVGLDKESNHYALMVSTIQTRGFSRDRAIKSLESANELYKEAASIFKDFKEQISAFDNTGVERLIDTYYTTLSEILEKSKTARTALERLLAPIATSGEADSSTIVRLKAIIDAWDNFLSSKGNPALTEYLADLNYFDPNFGFEGYRKRFFGNLTAKGYEGEQTIAAMEASTNFSHDKTVQQAEQQLMLDIAKLDQQAQTAGTQVPPQITQQLAILRQLLYFTRLPLRWAFYRAFAADETGGTAFNRMLDYARGKYAKFIMQRGESLADRHQIEREAWFILKQKIK